jgi:hypothetical protein
MGVAWVAFKVEPSAAASTDVSGAEPGDTGVGDDLEQATAIARRAAAAQETNLFWYIRKNPRLF